MVLGVGGSNPLAHPSSRGGILGYMIAQRLARVAELADALDLGSSIERCGGSNPPSRTS